MDAIFSHTKVLFRWIKCYCIIPKPRVWARPVNVHASPRDTNKTYEIKFFLSIPTLQKLHIIAKVQSMAIMRYNKCAPLPMMLLSEMAEHGKIIG